MAMKQAPKYFVVGTLFGVLSTLVLILLSSGVNKPGREQDVKRSLVGELPTTSLPPIVTSTKLPQMAAARLRYRQNLVVSKSDENSGTVTTKSPVRRKRPKLDESTKSPPVGLSKKFPEVLLIGSKKCGTGVFRKFLALNPNFAVANGEAHYFDTDKRYMKGLSFYQRRMPWSFPNQTTLEGTPRYLYTETVPARVKALNPDMKLAVLLCDPTKRLISDFVQLKVLSPSPEKALNSRLGATREKQTLDIMRQFGRYPSFQEIVFKENGEINSNYSAVRNGIYVELLEWWLTKFSFEQFHFIDGHRFQKKPWVELNKLADFAGVPAMLSKDNFVYDEERGFYCRHEEDGGCMNGTKGRKHPPITDDEIKVIRDFYRPHNERLFQLIGRKFKWD